MDIVATNRFESAAKANPESRAIFWAASLAATALLVGAGATGTLRAQTPALPAAAEPTAPASRIGPPVPIAPLTATPTQTAPLRGSSTNSMAPAGPDTTDITVPPLRPASGTRG